MSFSARVDRPLGAGAGAVAALTGSALTKLATVALLVDGGASTSASLVETLMRFVAAFATDGAFAFALVVFGVAFSARVASFVGFVVGIVCAVDVFFVLRFGAPFSPSQWAWVSSARAGMAGLDVVAAVVAVAIVVAAFVAAVRVAGSTVVAVAAALVVVGVGGGFVDGEHRELGLRRHAVLSLLAPTTTNATATKPFAAPLSKPEAAWSAPIDVDTRVRPRHVVLFLSESTASRFVDATTMPRLTALSKQHAVTFTEHVAESPISIKSIFALLCGLHPDPTSTLETTSLPRLDCDSLPEQLQRQGFDSALVHGGYFAFTDKLAFLNERGFSHLSDGETLRSRHCWTNGWGTDDRCVVDDAFAWLDAKDPTRPSLLVVIPLIPHHEYFLPTDVEGGLPAPPTPFGTRTLLDRYKNGLHFADDVFGRVVDGYAARGLADDTVFVFVGDHGEAFDEHPRNRLHGSFLYDENVRAPLVIVSARSFKTASTSQRPSTHADLLPTILDVLGLPASPTTQGQSLVSPSFAPKPQPLFTAVPTTKVGMRTPRFKLIHDVESGADELFDLVADAREQHNLAATERDVAAELRARAMGFLAEQPQTLRSMPTKEAATYLQRAAKNADVDVHERKVMNMARPCIPFVSGAQPVTVTLADLAPPARHVGIGVDDESRFKDKAARLDVDINGTAAFVDAGFLSSSVVVDVDDASVVTVTVRPTPRPTKGCLWLSP